ncbi:MAG: NAD regulator, partial [Rubricella sp.]
MTRAVRVELSAVVVALTGEGRETDLTVMMAPGPDLPGRAFDPDEHRTLELSLRDWVGRTTGLRLGFVEQLYTFGDRARDAQLGPDQPHKVSIGYLAVVPRDDERGTGGDWASVSQFFPWEDRRAGVPAILEEEIL